jgi:tetratricopeptide (TPR) repeat protein
MLVFILVSPSPSLAQPAANIVSIQGAGHTRPDEQAPWAAARVEQPLLAGHFVRTGDYSRMGLLFRDRTQLRLNEKTILQVIDATATTRLRLNLGRAWTRSKSLPDRLHMETPAATAAIRGTDWDIVVDEDGHTVITVLSGEVEFFNDFGRIVIRQDESAEASVGRAPTKLVFVRPRDRVQWVTSFSIDPLRHISLGDNPTERIKSAYAALRQGKLDVAQAALPENADSPGGNAELHALGLISLAILKGELGRAHARLTAMTRDTTPTQPAPYLLLADLMIYAGDTEKAIAHLHQGLARFPCEPRLYGALARTHLIADERGLSREAIAKARACDRRSMEIALAEGELARIEGDAPIAEAAYGSAVRLSPTDDRGWYGLGRVNTEKEAVREGRVNLLKAIELNPLGPGYQGELGTLESFANNFAEARGAFDQALARNPDDYVALTGLGLLELKRGNTDAALDAFLRAGLMEPRYARAHLYTAVAYYQTGRVQEALNELRHASQLDEKDPLPHFLTSIIHTDTLRPGLAIESARTARRLLPNLKSLNQLANDQQGLTNLGQAFAALGMEEWAQHYAQDSYYPFWAGSHLFLADHYPGLFNKNSALFQGFLADPTVFGGSNRFQTLIPRPVHNFGASMRLTSASDTFHGSSPQLQASGFTNGIVPLAYFVEQERFDMHLPDGPYDTKTTTLGLGVAPRHDLGMFVFSDRSELDVSYSTPFYDLDEHLKSDRADIGLHYKLNPDSRFWLKKSSFESKDDSLGPFFGAFVYLFTQVKQPESGLRHTFSAGQDHEVTWGIEEGHRETEGDFFDFTSFFPFTELGIYEYDERSIDSYVSDRWRASPNLLLQGDLFYQRHRRIAALNTYYFSGTTLLLAVPGPQERFSHSRINPRLGLVYRFENGPQLRLAYQRWQRPVLFSSLGPVATAGIPLDDRLVMRGGELERLRGQLEWEYSPRSFLSVHVDHKKIDNHKFSLATPFDIDELESLRKLRPRGISSLANDDMLEFSNTPEWDGGRVTSGGVALNHLLSEQWGLFGRYVHTSSRNTGPLFAGNDVPYLPRHMVAAGLTWSDPGGWYFISRLVHRSERYRDEANLMPLQAGWNGACDLFWQSRDKRWLFRVSADDAFDENTSTQYTAEVGIKF